MLKTIYFVQQEDITHNRENRADRAVEYERHTNTLGRICAEKKFSNVRIHDEHLGLCLSPQTCTK